MKCFNYLIRLLLVFLLQFYTSGLSFKNNKILEQYYNQKVLNTDEENKLGEIKPSKIKKCQKGEIYNINKKICYKLEDTYKIIEE